MHARDEHDLAELDAAFAAGDDLAVTVVMRRLDTEDRRRRTHPPPPEALHEAALAYAENGHPVFPLRPGGKTPLTRHGFHDATTNPWQVHEWWTATPDANIGLPTGLAFDVLDVDPDGWPALAEMREFGAMDDALALVSTPRGRHVYLPPSGRGNKAGFEPGVDYRGRGGYVVAPPSRTEAGTWQWTPGHELQIEGDPR